MSSFQRLIGSKPLIMDTGKLAQQANGSVLIRYGDCVLLVTSTMGKPRDGIDFFPLTIDFEEKLYARGKIPGSFFRREGRPSTDAILTDRLTDRPLRPLFPKGLRNEVQIIVTTLSADLENPLDLLAINGASAALCVSDIPFGGPIGATRVGFADGDYVINPTFQQLEMSQLDLVVAGSRAGVMMMEAGSNQVSEEFVLEGIRRGQEANLELIALQEEMVDSVGKAKVAFEAEVAPAGLEDKVGAIVDGRLATAMDSAGGKAEQKSQLESLKAEISGQLGDSYETSHIENAYEALVEKEFRSRILDKGERPDGRGLKDIRTLSCEVGILPRTHGTGLFSRGETQVLGIVTLGSVGDAQRLDTLGPKESARIMLHYNFPPFSTGETKRVGSPKRRDIGHGALAERALTPVLPSEEEFPYAIRLVAEVLSSNGSTSMGSACACSLALMDAGVPIKSAVAGISIGLITGDNGKFATMTDIQGMEDHFGDMDFKVAGTAEGITAIQLDIKVGSIGPDIIAAALAQGREARLVLLERMKDTIDVPRAEMSPYAPRMTRIMVPVAKIGAIIGPGGKMIRSIVEETKATIDVQDDGSVMIGSTDEAAARRAVEIIEGLTKEAKVGDIYTGKVVRILNFGAFVEILPGTDGMVHISELADYRVPNVEDVIQLGEMVTVEVIGIDPSGKIALSRRSLLKNDETPAEGASVTAQGEGAGPTPDRERQARPGGGHGGGGDRPRGDGRFGGSRPGQRPQSGWRGEQRGGPRSHPGSSDRRPPPR